MILRNTNMLRKYKKISNQSGVTIVIAMILLAGVVFASFTMASIILRDVKSARVIQDSEPAITGAYAGGETALFSLQRDIANLRVSDVSVSAGGTVYDVIPDLTDDPFSYVVTGAQDVYVNFYNPEDPEIQDTGIRSFTITNDTGSRRVDVEVVSWGNPQAILCSFTDITDTEPSNTRTCSNLSGPDYRYQLTIRASGGGAGTAAGTIRAFDASGAPVGIPSATPTFDVSGTLGDAQRRIRINLR